jgi:hypothetical protein
MADTGGQQWRYSAELPTDRSELAKAWQLLETYSHIPPDQVEAHVRGVVSRGKFMKIRATVLIGFATAR